MANQEALRRAFTEYKNKADAARQARERAKEARQEAERDETLSNAAQRAGKRANTAEKNRHLAKLATKDTHQPGEENGCVTKCVWEHSPPWARRCLFEGHNYKENAIRYHLANERGWYNPSFEVNASRARRRLEAHANEIILSRKTKNNPITNPGAWNMVAKGQGRNFWSGKKTPWQHQAHHIIPTDSLYLIFKEDLSLLQQLKYNINKGINIMILPTQETYGRIYLLPTHLGSHDDYGTEVENRLRSVRAHLSPAQEKTTEGHPDTNDALDNTCKKQLENHSKQLRKLLRRKGIKLGLDPTQSLKVNDIFKTPAGDMASS